MKRQWLLFTGVLAGLLISTGLNAQEDESPSKFSAGADLYSNYVWRGTKLGTGPACPAYRKIRNRRINNWRLGIF